MHRIFLCETRDLHKRAADSGNDRHHNANTRGSAQDIWDRDKRTKAGINKWVFRLVVCVKKYSLNGAQKSS